MWLFIVISTAQNRSYDGQDALKPAGIHLCHKVKLSFHFEQTILFLPANSLTPPPSPPQASRVSSICAFQQVVHKRFHQASCLWRSVGVWKWTVTISYPPLDLRKKLFNKQ